MAKIKTKMKTKRVKSSKKSTHLAENLVNPMKDSGSYVGKHNTKNAKLTKKQVYHLEKQRNKLYGKQLNQRAEVIKAYGQAMAYNVGAPLTEWAGGDAASKVISANVSGGAKQATKNNEDEQNQIIDNSSIGSFPID